MAVSTIALYSCDPAIPLTIPVVYIQQISGQVYQLLFSRMVIAAWFYNSFKQEISPMSSTSRMDKQVNMCSWILYNNVKKKTTAICISLSKKKPKISTCEFLCSSNTGKMILRHCAKNSSNKAQNK